MHGIGRGRDARAAMLRFPHRRRRAPFTVWEGHASKRRCLRAPPPAGPCRVDVAAHEGGVPGWPQGGKQPMLQGHLASGSRRPMGVGWQNDATLTPLYNLTFLYDLTPHPPVWPHISVSPHTPAHCSQPNRNMPFYL